MPDIRYDDLVDMLEDLRAITEYANVIMMAAHGMADDDERVGMSRLAADIQGRAEKALALVAPVFQSHLKRSQE